MDYLVFRLYAPLASWGEAAVGESRPTATYPGRAAIIGLLGAALGIKRDEDAGQQALFDSVRIAIKQYSPGLLMRDYHTTQVPAAQAKVRYRTRRDELNSSGKISTILSTRDYRCDGLWVVAVWLDSDAHFTLEALQKALLCPHFPLYLGRKSCPLAAPLQPEVIERASLKEALDFGFEPIPNEASVLRHRGDVMYCWEGEAESLDGEDVGVEKSEVWDDPLSRRRWQFSRRPEFRRRINGSERQGAQ